jgi:hypothetical protein
VISRILVFSAAVLLFSGVFSGGISSLLAQDKPAATSQPQSDSLGDAARQSRAQKPHSAKPAKVFTNDDVPRLKDSFPQKNKSKQTSRSSSAKPQSQHEATLSPVSKP